MRTLTWKDLYKLGEFDRANRFSATDETCLKYIDENGYRTPSRAYPYSHARPLMTKKFAKWVITTNPDFAQKHGII